MGKSKTGKIATALTALGSIFIIIAFTTPNWLVNDGQTEHPRFDKLGLWEVCFKDFQDENRFYDTKFSGCWWMFQEELNIIKNFLRKEPLYLTEFFFTFCLTLLLIGGLMTALYTCCSRHHTRYQELLWALGSILTLSGICGVISGLIFGFGGDVRYWMPDWEHNSLGYSYILACLGSLLILPAGVLFLIEGRRHKKRVAKMHGDDPKTHSNI